MQSFPSVSFLVFFLVIGNHSRAQDTIPPQKHLASLLVQYHQHTLSDTAYLNAVDSTASLLYNEDSLVQWLDTYRQIIFSDPRYGKYRVYYYLHLQRLSDNKSRYGSAIYYSEKKIKERIKEGIIDKDDLPTSELFAVAVHVCNRDYARVFSNYHKLRPLLLSMPARIDSAKKIPSPDGVSNAFGILDVMATAAWKTGDTAKLNEAVLLCGRMLEAVRKQPAKYAEYLTYYSFINHSISFYRAIYLDHKDDVKKLLAICLQEVRSETFGEVNSPNEYACDRYMEAFDFYFSQQQKDSAQHYLALIHALIPTEGEFMNERLTFWLEGNSKLQASLGNFSAAYQDLQKAYEMRVSALYAVNADKDNNLYALAKGENIHHELIRTTAKKQKAEHFNMLLFTAMGILVFGGGSGFLVYRSKQKRRLLNLQLSLARNFHDEIGPMVMYAGILVKKESEINPSPRLDELKGHMRQIMETVRSISQDLKSNKLSTVNFFYNEIAGLLKKIKASTQIDFLIRLNKGSQILSHLQFTTLRKIVSEMVTNSIKHAECDMITIQLKVMERHLRISYSDNGKGIAYETQTGGIGIQNIRERVGLLKGDFQLNNFYPEGYSIDISIPLL